MKDPALYWKFPFYRYPSVYCVDDRRRLRCAICKCIPNPYKKFTTLVGGEVAVDTCGSAYCRARVDAIADHVALDC